MGVHLFQKGSKYFSTSQSIWTEEGWFFFWTRFHNFTVEWRKINYMVVPILNSVKCKFLLMIFVSECTRIDFRACTYLGEHAPRSLGRLGHPQGQPPYPKASSYAPDTHMYSMYKRDTTCVFRPLYSVYLTGCLRVPAINSPAQVYARNSGVFTFLLRLFCTYNVRERWGLASVSSKDAGADNDSLQHTRRTQWALFGGSHSR